MLTTYLRHLVTSLIVGCIALSNPAFGQVLIDSTIERTGNEYMGRELLRGNWDGEDRYFIEGGIQFRLHQGVQFEDIQPLLDRNSFSLEHKVI